MKNTYAYTRYTSPKELNKTGSYLAGHRPTFLGVTLNMDDKNRAYRPSRLEYPEDRYRVLDGDLGHRYMIDRASGEEVSLNDLLGAGEIAVYEVQTSGDYGPAIRSMAGAPPPEECEKPGPTPCAHCRGTGKVTAHVDYADRSRSGVQQINCLECGGSGTLTPEKIERMRIGEERRADRLARDMSLRQEAVRLGITPSALTRLERGELVSEGELE